MTMRAPLTVPESARQEFSYDVSTGELWRVAVKGMAVPPRLCRTLNTGGYITVSIGARAYLAHRVIWFLMTGENPDGQLDHINGNKTDNRIANLRLATASENTMNRPKFGGLRANGLPKGVKRVGNSFQARIAVHRQRIHLGTFRTESDASAAYRAAAAEYHGSFARLE